MGCNCDNKNEGNFPPSVLQVNSAQCPVLFHKVVIPTNFGDETETPVLMGKYKNALVYYEANGHAYLYSSDGVPTRLDRGGASVLYVDELPETSKAMQDTLYVSSRGELAVYKNNDKKILNEKPTYYTTLGNNTDGAMTQKAVTDALSALSEEVKNKLAEFKNGVVDKVMPEVNDKVSNMERFVTTKIEEMKRETSTLVNTTTNDVNLMNNKLNKHIEQADIVKNDLLDKIRRNTDSITDTKNGLRNYALISDVDSRVMDAEARVNNKITQAETRVNNTIGQAKTELNGKITEANGKISALDARLTKQASDNKADITQLKANLNTTNSALLTHKEQADKKFDDIKVEQSDQDTLISDILNAFSAESEKGTNLKLNSSATKVLGVSIYGNTEQAKYTGKNLLKLSTNPTISNGLSSTVSDDGLVKYSGRTTNSWGDITTLLYFPAPLTAGKYTFSIDHPRTHRIIFKYKLADNTFSEIIANMTETSTSNTFTTTQPIVAGYLYIAAANSSSLNDTVKAQLEIGDTATDYEPYTGGYNNLFDESSELPKTTDGITVTNQNGILKLTGLPTRNWVNVQQQVITPLLVNGGTYTLVNYNVTDKGYLELSRQRKNGSWEHINTLNKRILTFTVDFNTYSLYKVQINMGPVASYNNQPITMYNNYALFQGDYTKDNLPEYSPYNTGLASPRPQLPQVVKELSGGNIKVVNKNLAVLENKPYTNTDLAVQVNEDSSITVQGENKNFWGMNITTNKFIDCPLKKGDIVTLSIDKPLPYTIKWYAMRDDNIAIDNFCNILAGETSKTATIPANLLYGRLFFNISQIGLQVPPITFKVQLEYGDTATPFVSHESARFTLPSGLNIYKLTDDIYDEVKLENGVAKMIKRVGKLELSGEEEFKSISTVNSGQYYVFSRVLDKLANTGVSNFICSHFDIFSGTLGKGTLAQKSLMSLKLAQQNDIEALRFMFSAPDALNLKNTDVASFKNWLKSEKDKGTPVTIYYEMKTPTEEEITDPALLTELKKLMEMRTYKGVTNISVTGGSLVPDIKVKYMRKIGE